MVAQPRKPPRPRRDDLGCTAYVPHPEHTWEQPYIAPWTRLAYAGFGEEPPEGTYLCLGAYSNVYEVPFQPLALVPSYQLVPEQGEEYAVFNESAAAKFEMETRGGPIAGVRPKHKWDDHGLELPAEKHTTSTSKSVRIVGMTVHGNVQFQSSTVRWRGRKHPRKTGNIDIVSLAEFIVLRRCGVWRPIPPQLLEEELRVVQP